MNYKNIKLIDIAVLLSTAIHLGIFLILSQLKEREMKQEDLREISFIDQSYRPEVAKVLSVKPSAELKKQIPPTISGDENLTSSSLSEEISNIDITAKIERTQAKIDLSYFPLEAEKDEIDVIRIGNSKREDIKSTGQILQEVPIILSSSINKKGWDGGFGVYTEIKREEPIKLETKTIIKDKPKIKEEIPKEEERLIAKEIKGAAFTIAGPISERRILKKVLPQYPTWALERKISGYVVVKVWVTPKGTVREDLELVESSGYPELDKLILEAVRQWQFAALGENVKKETQWGIIKFRFELS